MKVGAWLVAVASSGVGCSGVQRPFKAEPCPAGAVSAMNRMGIPVDLPAQGPKVLLDVAQPVEKGSNLPAYVKTGPLRSQVSRGAPSGVMMGAVLTGEAWVTGYGVYVRYYEAQLSNGRMEPVCFQLYARGQGAPVEREPVPRVAKLPREGLELVAVRQFGW